VKQDGIEIAMGKNALIYALDRNYIYAICRLTVDLEDQETILPDLEGHSVDFFIEDFSAFQGKNCKSVVERFSKA